jgi:hypothetical protein
MSIGMNLSALPMYKEYIDNLASFYTRNSVIAQRILTEDNIKYCFNYKVKNVKTTCESKSELGKIFVLLQTMEN